MRIPLPLFLTSLRRRIFQSTPSGSGTKERMHFKLGLETAPVIGVLLLLAGTCIPGSVLADGIVGSEGVRPYDIMTLFISFVSPICRSGLGTDRRKLILGLHIHLTGLYWCPTVSRPFGRYEIRFIRFIPLFRLLLLLLPHWPYHRKRPPHSIGYSLPRLLYPTRGHHARIPNLVPVHSFSSIKSSLCITRFVESYEPGPDFGIWDLIPPIFSLVGFTDRGGDSCFISTTPLRRVSGQEDPGISESTEGKSQRFTGGPIRRDIRHRTIHHRHYPLGLIIGSGAVGGCTGSMEYHGPSGGYHVYQGLLA